MLSHINCRIPACKKNSDVSIDFTRIIACIMVILLHVAAINFYSWSENWWAANFYDSLSRCSVPIFLLISGSVLFKKEDNILLFLQKRFIRIFPPLIFWSIFYMLWNGINYEMWLQKIIQNNVMYHFWYLYAIIGIYLYTPFLIKIYANSSDIERKIFILIWVIISSIWPILQKVLQIKFDFIGNYYLQPFFGLFGYLFLGAYLFDKINEKYSTNWSLINYFSFILFSVLTMIATFLYSKKIGLPNETFYEFLSPFVLISAICAFNILYSIGLKLEKHSFMINAISRCTMGIYCIHVFIIDRISVLTGLPGVTNSPWWSIPVTTFFVFVTSLTIIVFMRMIKPLQYVT